MRDTGERLIAKGNEQTLTYGEHLSRYQAVLGLVKNKVVLDVASGTGYGTAMLADAGAKLVHGLDYSKEAVLYSEKNYHRKNIEFTVGDAHELPYKDKSIDVVVSLETIEHLKDTNKFITEIKRVLKPDGVFIVSTPNDEEFMEGNDFHLHEFQLPELKKLIDSKFTSSEYYFQGTYFSVALQSEEDITTPNRKKIDVTKTFALEKEKAIYYIAVATNSRNVPMLEKNVVLADRWNTKDNIEQDLQKRKEIEKFKNEAINFKIQNELLNKKIEALLNSTSWKLTAWLRKLSVILGR